MSKKKELRDCRLCKATARKRSFLFYKLRSETVRYYFVVCSLCFINTKNCFREEESIKLWNEDN